MVKAKKIVSECMYNFVTFYTETNIRVQKSNRINFKTVIFLLNFILKLVVVVVVVVFFFSIYTFSVIMGGKQVWEKYR